MTSMEHYRKSFIDSARARHNHFQDLEDTRRWLQLLRQRPEYQVTRIPLADMAQWYFDADSGNLRHRSGKFFSITGLRCAPGADPAASWDQPIIQQPEIGILGIITREFHGTRYFLMQAKMEPGNINKVQLSPTLQATYSNYSQTHKGKLPPYTELFLEPGARVINSQLQSETGTRFLRKFNRNILLDSDADIPLLPGFRWLTLYEIQQLMAEDDTVNMDARSVLSNIAYAEPDESGAAHRTLEQLREWLLARRASLALHTEDIPLNAVRDWVRDAWAIRHVSQNYFEVAGVRVEAGDREVPQWCQPLLKHDGLGLAGFLCAEINGVMHFLLQAKPEPGIVGSVELAPTVSLFDYQSRALSQSQSEVPYLEYFLAPAATDVLHSSIQSEEGGRFWGLRNHYLVIRLPEAIEATQNHQWLTLAQLRQLSQGESLVNSEARSLLACLRLFE